MAKEIEQLSNEEAGRAELFIKSSYPSFGRKVEKILDDFGGLAFKYGASSNEDIVSFWIGKVEKMATEEDCLSPEDGLTPPAVVTAIRKFEKQNNMEESITTTKFLTLLIVAETSSIRKMAPENRIQMAESHASDLLHLLDFYLGIH